MFYNKDVVNIRDSLIHSNTKVSVNINEIFVATIVKGIKEGSKILDIGTGNGYVLNEIRKVTNDDKGLYGIDNSKYMVEEAIKNGLSNIFVSDNYSIPFEDGFFDIVTAKNVTRFSAEEIFRVLKPNGVFVYREYGIYKGLVEISKLFENRLIRSRDCSYYVEKLSKAGFSSFEIKKYLIEKEYDSIESVINVVSSFPYVEGLDENDKDLIRDYLKSNGLVIKSDPFILVGGKYEDY